MRELSARYADKFGLPFVAFLGRTDSFRQLIEDGVRRLDHSVEQERRVRDTGVLSSTELADAVLPLIRTRKDLHRLRAANDHGAAMHRSIDILEQAAATEEPAAVYSVTHRALSSAVKVIARGRLQRHHR